MKRFSYGARDDIFSVHLGFSADEKFRTNIVAGDIILDLPTKNRIRGLEILNAGQFFEEFGVDESMLNNLSDVELSAMQKLFGIAVRLVLKSSDKEVPIKFAVALEEPYINPLPSL